MAPDIFELPGRLILLARVAEKSVGAPEASEDVPWSDAVVSASSGVGGSFCIACSLAHTGCAFP
jgi:hypothetical protein